MLPACSTVDVAQYAHEKPALDMQQYFNGTIDAWGMFQDRSGKVVKRFTVVIQCNWKDDVGTLDEDFSYSDGTTQKRVWTLKKDANGQYVGTAADVVGERDRQHRRQRAALELCAGLAGRRQGL